MIFNNLSKEEKEILSAFWKAWREIRESTGYGDVKLTMQAKRLKHVIKTATEMKS